MKTIKYNEYVGRDQMDHPIGGREVTSGAGASQGNKYTISYYRAILESCINYVTIDEFAVGVRKYITERDIIETRMLLNVSKALRICFERGLVLSIPWPSNEEVPGDSSEERIKYIISDKGKDLLRVLRIVDRT